jgi:hypothetical protein
MQTEAKRCLRRAIVFAAVAVGLSGCATNPRSQPGPAPTYNVTPQTGTAFDSAQDTAELGDLVWPRYVVNGNTTNIVYQPQVDSWDGHQLVGRNAVAILSSNAPGPVYGAVTIRATTLVDKTAHTVALEDIEVLNGDFPSARLKSKDYVKLLQQTFPKELKGLSLERLEASFAVAPQKLKSSSGTLNNTPPQIIFAMQPAVLVLIDGPPKYKPVPESDVQRVVNSGMLLLKDPAGQYYLRLSDGYMSAPGLAGPWTLATHLPKGTAEAEKEFGIETNPGLVAPQAVASEEKQPSPSRNQALLVYVATTPTELVMFEGEPNFVPIPGTHLLYVANTTANVFKLLTDQKTYVLLSGRWFRSASLDGPWEYVPATQLALDFQNIPNTSPKENVKASVPGTGQATEALIANSIPQSTKVQRNAQMRDPQIDGPPQLKPIEGTPLYYVANSGTPIIQVDENSWYACQDGVWFASTSVNGPWTVASFIPAVIYSIPPSSPLHYVTYVRIYGSQPDYVYEGYTPGYLGSEVEDGVVVYGTGYYYPPWVGGVWYGYPVTWGFGWGPCWTPWYDWCFCFGFGWGYGYGACAWHYCHPPCPWWGPYHYWTHEPTTLAVRHPERVSTAANVYQRPERSGSRGGTGNSPSTGREVTVGYARAYNSRTGSPVAGQLRGSQDSLGVPTALTGRNGYPSAFTSRRSAVAREGTFHSSWGRDGSVAPRHAPSATSGSWGSGRGGLPGGYGRSGVATQGSSTGVAGGRGGSSGGGHSGGGGGHSGGGGGGGGHGGGGSGHR